MFVARSFACVRILQKRTGVIADAWKVRFFIVTSHSFIACLLQKCSSQECVCCLESPSIFTYNSFFLSLLFISLLFTFPSFRSPSFQFRSLFIARKTNKKMMSVCQLSPTSANAQTKIARKAKKTSKVSVRTVVRAQAVAARKSIETRFRACLR